MIDVTEDIQRVIDYIETHLKEDISIAALAEIAGYSPWHMYHLFMRCVGTPVMEYVRLRRLNSAVGELAQGRKLIDIAMGYGFETQAGFYKAFQRHFGCSPTRYRSHKLRQVNHQIPSILKDVARGGEDMEDRVIVRIVQEDDAEDLWENIFSRDTLNEVRNRVTSLYLKEHALGKAIPLVAEVDGHVIGVIYMAFAQHPLETHICTLGDVVVNPGFQRMGIAHRLIEECKKYAVKKGKSMMKVSTRGGTTAETVYGKLGFIEYGRLPYGIMEQPPFWDKICAFDEVLLYMPLAECE